MKKIFTLLFTALMVFSLAMPVFAQDSASAPAPKAEKKAKKEHKSKKEHKESKPETKQ